MGTGILSSKSHVLDCPLQPHWQHRLLRRRLSPAPFLAPEVRFIGLRLCDHMISAYDGFFACVHMEQHASAAVGELPDGVCGLPLREPGIRDSELADGAGDCE